MELYHGTVIHDTCGYLSIRINANSLEDAAVLSLTRLRELMPYGNFTKFEITLIGGKNND
jgi:hypothetical protein